MRKPRRYLALWQKIKEQENLAVVLYVNKSQQYTVKRMLGKERYKDQTLLQRDSHVFEVLERTNNTMTVRWRKFSGVDVAPLVNNNQPLYINVAEELGALP
jgi:hypothetical protein